MESTDLYSTTPTDIIMYGTTYCPDCRRARAVFSRLNITYQYIDIQQDSRAAEFVQHVNKGYRSVPTIIFPDGTMLVEPSDLTLTQKLNTSSKRDIP